MALVLASVLICRLASETGWKRSVAVARRCFADSKADIIDSFHWSCQGVPERASVRGRRIAAMLGRNCR